MRYLPTIGLAAALLLPSCQDKNPLKDFKPTSEKAFSTNEGAVKIYIRDHRTIYCEVAWETRHPDSHRPIKLTLSSSGGGRFYDIGEVAYLDEPEPKPEYWDADARGYRKWLTTFSVRANQKRDHILKEFGFSEEKD